MGLFAPGARILLIFKKFFLSVALANIRGTKAIEGKETDIGIQICGQGKIRLFS